MKRVILSTIILLFATLQVMAQSVSLRAQAPSMVEVGEKFRVQYSVNTQNVSKFDYPDFAGLQVLYGPSTSSSSSIQIINGQMSQSSSYTYTFTVMAEKEGTVTIPPASVVADGKTVKSNSLKIQVVKGSGNAGNGQGAYSQRQQRGQQRQYQDRADSRQQSQSISNSDLFMTATASRTNVYEQEAILITYKVYTLVNLTQLDGKLPTLDGFQIQDIPLPHNKEFTIEQYNGRNYNSVVWTQYVVFPQRSGDLKIPSLTYEGVVVQQNRNIDPIEAFFNGTGGMIEVKKKITTPALTIHVKPLPSKPDNFSSAVGQFSVSSSISSKDVTAYDAITLKVKVSGTGNMKLIETPAVKFPKDFETYDAKVNDNFSITRNGLSGVKEFEYLAVPRHPGKYTIPPVEFVYFDTSSHTYKTIKTEPYEINVKKGANSGSQASNYTNQQDIQELAQDIRYIKKGDMTLRTDDNSLYTSWKYWMGYLIAFIAFVVIVVLGRKRIKDNANVAMVRGKKANKVALKRMKVAAKLLLQKDQNQFYDEVMRALYGYVADKLNIPLANLNKDNINAQLGEKQVPQELTDQFIKALADCEFARYAPGDANENMENVYDSAINAITRMEESITKVKSDKPKGKGGTSALTVMLLVMGLTCTSFVKAETTGEQQDKLQQAAALYAAEKYDEAAALYEKVLAEDGIAPEVYYNLGNCYYKQDRIALSVLNYERALRLNPSDSDVKANLALARGKTQDKVTPASELFFVSWWKQLAGMMSMSAWMTVALIAFILMLTGILVYAFLSDIRLRKIGAYTAIVCLLLTVLANLCALTQHFIVINHSYAIIMTPAVTVKSSPANTSTDLFIVHEGSKVEILDDTMAGWREVKLEEGKQGWIEQDVIAEI